jgi:hypothetical protein
LPSIRVDKPFPWAGSAAGRAMKEVEGSTSRKSMKEGAMYSSLARHRVAAAVAGLLIAGSGALAATPALAAAPAPGAGAGSAAAAPAGGSSTATPAAGQSAQAAAEPKGKVVSRLPLSIRAQATSNSKYLGSLQPGAVVALHCKVTGQNVDGNNRWYRLGAGRTGYVAARYVQNLATVPWC